MQKADNLIYLGTYISSGATYSYACVRVSYTYTNIIKSGSLIMVLKCISPFV